MPPARPCPPRTRGRGTRWHATAQETLDTYGHLWPDAEDRTRAAVEAALGPMTSEAPGDASGLQLSCHGALARAPVSRICHAEQRKRGKPLHTKGADASRSVSRILSPPEVGDGHPSGTPVARRLARSDPGPGTSSPWARRAAPVPVRPCSGRGLPGRPVTRPPVGSYPTISPSPRPRPRLCHFCGTLLRVTPTGCCPAPCSLESGLSSGGGAARGRPTGLPSQCTPARRGPRAEGAGRGEAQGGRRRGEGESPGHGPVTPRRAAHPFLSTQWLHPAGPHRCVHPFLLRPAPRRCRLRATLVVRSGEKW
jgi:hypothetical protein